MRLRIIHTQVGEKLSASGLAAHMNTLKLKVTQRITVLGCAQEQERAVLIHLRQKVNISLKPHFDHL